MIFYKFLRFAEPSEEPTIFPTSSIASSALSTTSNFTITDNFNISEIPTEAPSVFVSQNPSPNYVLTVNTPLHVPYYSTSHTSSATINTVSYTFKVCFESDIHIIDCDPDRCQSGTNDQFIRLYSNGIEVAYNDNSCSFCSVINYRIVSNTCQIYTLQQGCYRDTQCSGNFTITLVSSGARTTGNNAIYSNTNTFLILIF